MHIRKIQKDNKRTQFIALENGYQGETLGSLSVSELGLYKKPYTQHLWNTQFIGPPPYVTGQDDPFWHNTEAAWVSIEKN